jgi:Fe-S-cluster containining protein
VDRDKRELFHASVQEKEKSLACPFLRRLASCERICTIYTSRPDLCRSYLCSLSSFSIGTGKKPGWCLTGPNPSE